MTIKLPALKTLATYGLSMDEWIDYLGAMGTFDSATCCICERAQEQFVVDHEHVRDYKELPPAKRKLYVRGVVCRSCNYYVLQGQQEVSPLEHRNAADYLEAYEKRRPQ